MKIGTIIGARPQFVKAAPLSKLIHNDNLLSETIIHTGQHFEKNMSDIFFDEMEISKPKYNLDINSLPYGKMVEKIAKRIKPILINEKFDGIIVFGDTNSTIAGSLAASNLKIPIFHIEAGLRSYNRSMPEEINRIITDHLSTLLFCPTSNAVQNLKKESINKGVFLSGDIMYDSYKKFSILNKKHFYQKKNNNRFILATIHRRENIDNYENLSKIFYNLDKIYDKIKIIMPLHPHTKKKIKDYKIETKLNMVEPLGYIDMLSLLGDCELVITDSGGLQKEAFFAKKKCLIVRMETEWPELVENGTNLLSSPNEIFQYFNKFIKKECDFSSSPYGEGKASEFILESIKKYLY